MKLKSTVFIVILMACSLVAQAQIPRTFSLQGMLTDAGGNALSNGSHQLRITVYTQSSGGSGTYTETHSAMIKDGVFSVVVGSVTPIPGTMMFDRKYYAGISVDGGAELTPRTELTAVPFALNAAHAEKAGALAAGATGVVTNINGADGAVTLTGGGSTTVTRNGQSILISSAGGGGTGIAGLQNTDGTISIQNPNGPVATIGIPDNSIHGNKIQPGAINFPHLIDGAVTTAKLADQSVNRLKIRDEAIFSSHMSPGAVTFEALVDGSVRHAKIADNGIPLSKLNIGGAHSGDVPMLNGSAVEWTALPGGGGLTLPYNGQAASADAAFSLKNTAGSGLVAEGAPGKNGLIGSIGKPWIRLNVGVLGFASAGEGVCGESESGLGVRGWSKDGTGVLGLSNTGIGIEGRASSSGVGVKGTSSGTQSAILAENSSSGTGLRASSVSGMAVRGSSNTGIGMYAVSTTNIALKAMSQSGDIIQASSGVAGGLSNLRFRVTTNGSVRADGTFIPGGADLAEGIDFEGQRQDYEPGDVLVISPDNDRRIMRCSAPNSRAVVGVYATKPGMLLTPRKVGDDISDLIPMGVIGIIPTKVCMENGAIRRGDLLVTSSTAGHAMKAVPVIVDGVELYPTGAVLGKALQNFNGQNTGMIEVLVNVK